MKEIDFTKSVYDLAMSHDDFLDIMAELGFDHMRECVKTNPMTKEITLRDAANNHEANFELIVEHFKKHGYDPKY